MPEKTDAPQPSGLRQVAALAGAGIQFTVMVSLCTAGGWWLDERLGSSPWLLLAGGLVGSAAACFQLYRTLIAVSANTGSGKNQEKSEE